MIYIVNMISILLYAFLLRPDRKEGIRRKAFCTIVCIQLTCISGLQYDVGQDYIPYLRIYEAVGQISWKELPSYFYFREPVYCIYTKLMSVLFHENFAPYFLGMAFATAFFLMKGIYDRKENIVWSTYIYLSMGLFYISMNQIRQLIALSIILYSIQYIENKNWKKYLLWILIAAGIHNSALIMLPCFVLRDIKLRSRKKALGLLLLIFLGLYFFSPIIIEEVIGATSYGWMLEFQAGEVDNMIFNLMYRGALLLGCIYYIRPVLQKDKKYEVLYWLSIVGIIFQIMSVYATSIARITTYFYAVFIFLIPVVVQSIMNKKIRFLAKLVIIFGMLSYHIFYLVYRLNFMPYQSVFSIT